MKWLQDIRWGRMTLVFPVLAFCLCFLCMVWAFCDGDRVGGSVLATMCGVNLAAALAIYWYTRREGE